MNKIPCFDDPSNGPDYLQYVIMRQGIWHVINNLRTYDSQYELAYKKKLILQQQLLKTGSAKVTEEINNQIAMCNELLDVQRKYWNQYGILHNETGRVRF